MAVVTAVRARGASVDVELDDRSWRTLPAEVVVEAGLAPGVELDAPRVRALAQARRRHRANAIVLRALARRDHSRASLEGRLARAGVVADERAAVVERAVRSGLVDDTRFASSRAEALAARGKGDEWILGDLLRQGIEEHVAREAIGGLEPERDRALRLAAAHGPGARTALRLAARGFSHEVVEELVANSET